MKNKLKKISTGLLFFLIVSILSLGIVSAADYGDIRDQVNSVSSGGTINLGSDTYTSDGSYVGISGKNLTIRGSSNSNRATLNGGDQSAAFIIDSASTVTFRYINFVGASSPGFSAIRANGTIIVENCTFSSCNGDSGAAIYLREASVGSRIVNTRFIDNKADNTGDNAYAAGGAICVHGADNVEIRNCYFSGNTALSAGGALTLRDDATNTKIINCEFVNNRAPNGGAIYNQLSTGTVISGCTFTNNQATTGGAICSINVISITSSTFNKNTAKNIGGAIYTSGTSGTTITGSTFTSNSAKNGGAIYSTSTLAISSSKLSSNKATSNGGAIYSKNVLNISKSIISKNSANYGSGVYSSNTLRVDSSTLSSNSAKFIKMMISSSNSAKSGSNVAIKAGLVYGDNVAGTFYTTNGNVYINGKKSIVSSFSPNKKITLKFNGKSVSGKSNSNGIATFNVVVSKISKTTTYKATVSSTQGSKTFSTSKNIKFTVGKSTSKYVSDSVSSSNVVRASASSTVKTTSNVVLPISKTSNTSSKGVKEVYNSNKKKWVKVSMSKTYNDYPDKKLRIKTKHTKKTVKYQFVSKMQKNKKTKPNKSTTVTTKTYRKGNKIIKSTTTVKVYYKYNNLKNPFLSASIGCEINHPTIKNLAKKFKNIKNKNDRANAIYKYVRKYVTYVSDRPNDAVGAWNTKKTNCVGFAHLIVAISRASGIPAKYEQKAIANGKYSHSGHVWSLLYVNGKWVKADGTIKIVDSKGKLLKNQNANLKIGAQGQWGSYKTVKGGHEIISKLICNKFYPDCTSKIDKNGNHIDSEIHFCKVNHNGWK